MVEIRYYNLEGDFKSAPVGRFTSTVYYRLSLSSILSEVDKIIYADLDTINLEDLSEMYNISFNEKIYFCGVLDNARMIKELKKFNITGNKYINSGVLLINLKGIRNDGIENKMREFISTHIIPTVDQTVINVVCYNNIQILPYKYSIFAYDSFDALVNINGKQDSIYRYNESELKRAFEKPTFFHYYALNKPWKKYFKKFNRVYWWYYAKMSGFYQEIIDYYKFKINDIEELLKQIPADGGLLKGNYKNFNNKNNKLNISINIIIILLIILINYILIKYKN